MRCVKFCLIESSDVLCASMLPCSCAPAPFRPLPAHVRSVNLMFVKHGKEELLGFHVKVAVPADGAKRG
jgi:hypothetical protein